LGRVAASSGRRMIFLHCAARLPLLAPRYVVHTVCETRHLHYLCLGLCDSTTFSTYSVYSYGGTIRPMRRYGPLVPPRASTAPASPAAKNSEWFDVPVLASATLPPHLQHMGPCPPPPPAGDPRLRSLVKYAGVRKICPLSPKN